MESQAIKTEYVLRLIRCRKTGRYLGPEGWTEKPEDGRTFEDNVDAVRACVESGLHDVELVLRPPGADHDLFRTTLR